MFTIINKIDFGNSIIYNAESNEYSAYIQIPKDNETIIARIDPKKNVDELSFIWHSDMQYSNDPELANTSYKEIPDKIRKLQNMQTAMEEFSEFMNKLLKENESGDD